MVFHLTAVMCIATAGTDPIVHCLYHGLTLTAASLQGQAGTVQQASVEWTGTLATAGETSLRAQFKVYQPTLFQQLPQASSPAGPSAAWFHDFLSEGELVDRGQLAHSGSKFYATRNHQFLLKTITRSERKFLSGPVLQRYVDYFVQESESLLVRFIGLYRLRWRLQGKRGWDVAYMVVMKNGAASIDMSIFDFKAFGLVGLKI